MIQKINEVVMAFVLSIIQTLNTTLTNTSYCIIYYKISLLNVSLGIEEFLQHTPIKRIVNYLKIY